MLSPKETVNVDCGMLLIQNTLLLLRPKVEAGFPLNMNFVRLPAKSNGKGFSAVDTGIVLYFNEAALRRKFSCPSNSSCSSLLMTVCLFFGSLKYWRSALSSSSILSIVPPSAWLVW